MPIDRYHRAVLSQQQLFSHRMNPRPISTLHVSVRYEIKRQVRVQTGSSDRIVLIQIKVDRLRRIVSGEKRVSGLDPEQVFREERNGTVLRGPRWGELEATVAAVATAGVGFC